MNRNRRFIGDSFRMTCRKSLAASSLRQATRLEMNQCIVSLYPSYRREFIFFFSYISGCGDGVHSFLLMFRKALSARYLRQMINESRSLCVGPREPAKADAGSLATVSIAIAVGTLFVGSVRTIGTTCPAPRLTSVRSPMKLIDEELPRLAARCDFQTGR